MDPLSGTASIISIIQLSTEVVKYITSAAGASSDRKRLQDEIRACQFILQQIEDEVNDADQGGTSTWASTLKALDSALDGLFVALSTIKTKLDRKGPRRTFKWPFEEKETEKTMMTIERAKGLLGIALTNDCRKLIEETKKSVIANEQQLVELVQLTKDNSNKTNGKFEEMKIDLEQLQSSNTGLQGGLSALHLRYNDRKIWEERQTILEWPAPGDFVSQQSDYFHRKQPGTGKWLFDSAAFQQWLETKNETILCTGIPGAGKTILASSVINSLQARFEGDDQVGVVYVYFDFRRQAEHDEINILSNVLRQLSQERTTIPDVLQALYRCHVKSQKRPTLADVTKSLQSVSTSFSRIFIIVDALDECQAIGNCRMNFLSAIFELQRICGLNLFVTSRPIPDITGNFRNNLSLEIRGDKEDMRKYVESHISSLPRFVRDSDELQDLIATQIVEASDGMFLLAVLHMESLIGKRSPKAVRVALSKLHTGSNAYDKAYDDAMKRIEGQIDDQELLAKQVLSWIVCAEKPLTVVELQHALAVEKGDTELDEDNIPQAEDLISVCAGLVTVDDESGVIRLIHYTTQEYFNRTQNAGFPDSDTYITSICVTYLSFKIFESGMHTTFNDLKERWKLNILYRYAAINWGHHARRSGLVLPEIMQFLRSSAHRDASTQRWKNSEHYRQGRLHFPKPSDTRYNFPMAMQEIHLVAYFGLEAVLRQLINGEVAINAVDHIDRTALSYAASEGHENIVRLLINAHGTKSGTQNNDYSPIDIDCKDDDDRTPLMWATKNGHVGAVKELLNNGADPNRTDRWHRTAIWYACHANHIELVEILIRIDNICINRRDIDGITPIFAATECRNEDIILLLLDQGVDTNVRDTRGRNLLYSAASKGLSKIVKKLIERGDDPNCQATGGKTPLLQAVKMGEGDIVELLLAYIATNPDIADIEGRTPLSYSAELGERKIVQSLLATVTINPNTMDKAFRTPMFYAAANGCISVLQLMISDKRILKDSRDFYGATPLMVATIRRQEEAVQLLIEQGCDINLQDRFGRTSLSWVCNNQDHAMEKPLLKNYVGEEAQMIQKLFSVFDPAIPKLTSITTCFVCTRTASHRVGFHGCFRCRHVALVICAVCRAAGAHCLDRDHVLNEWFW